MQRFPALLDHAFQYQLLLKCPIVALLLLLPFLSIFGIVKEILQMVDKLWIQFPHNFDFYKTIEEVFVYLKIF